MTVQGMQQQSHSTPSPQGQEMQGFVDPLIGFEMVEMTEEDVDDGGIARKYYLSRLTHGLRLVSWRIGSPT